MWMAYRMPSLVLVKRIVLWIRIDGLISFYKGFFVEIIRTILIISGRSTAIFFIEMFRSKVAGIHFKPSV